jgi:putative SOS response-associated peptidase YedK
MCNLYSIKTRRIDLARKFGLSDNRMAAFDTLAAIFPGHVAPIIKQSDDGARELVLRSWGFVLLRDGYAPKRVTNTRDDKVHTKFWKDSFEKRRCLFAFPGIYRQWKGPIRKDGPNADIEVFSFLTTLPNALTETINHERSPVLLTGEEEFSTWLTGTPEEAFGLIKASDPASMEIVQSGLEKKDLLAAA